MPLGGVGAMSIPGLSSRTASLSPQAGEAWWWLGGLATIKLAAEHTEGRFSLIEMIWPPDLEVPLHVHTREDELFFLLEGKISYRVGESRFDATPSHTLLAPKNVPHSRHRVPLHQWPGAAMEGPLMGPSSGISPLTLLPRLWAARY